MRLGPLIKRWRLTEEKELTELAGEIGISPAVLGRFEKERPVNAESTVKLLMWAMTETVFSKPEDTTQLNLQEE